MIIWMGESSSPRKPATNLPIVFTFSVVQLIDLLASRRLAPELVQRRNRAVHGFSPDGSCTTGKDSAAVERSGSNRSRSTKGSASRRSHFDSLTRVPGIELLPSNMPNVANTEEVDIFLWNERLASGLYFLETPLMVECKNWGVVVTGHEVVYFSNSMRNRGCKDGVLVASNGISGEAATLTEAHYELAMALTRGQRILVITRAEVEAFTTSPQLADLLKLKLVDLTINGTKVG